MLASLKALIGVLVAGNTDPCKARATLAAGYRLQGLGFNSGQ